MSLLLDEAGPLTAFDRAALLVARQLASFRLGLEADDPYAYTENEKLMAGHIVGNLLANGLLDQGDEKWVRVESDLIPSKAEQKR